MQPLNYFMPYPSCPFFNGFTFRAVKLPTQAFEVGFFSAEDMLADLCQRATAAAGTLAQLFPCGVRSSLIENQPAGFYQSHQAVQRLRSKRIPIIQKLDIWRPEIRGGVPLQTGNHIDPRAGLREAEFQPGSFRNLRIARRSLDQPANCRLFIPAGATPARPIDRHREDLVLPGLEIYFMRAI